MSLLYSKVEQNDPIAQLCILLGFNIKTKKIIVSRDVIFKDSLSQNYLSLLLILYILTLDVQLHHIILLLTSLIMCLILVNGVILLLFQTYPTNLNFISLIPLIGMNLPLTPKLKKTQLGKMQCNKTLMLLPITTHGTLFHFLLIKNQLTSSGFIKLNLSSMVPWNVTKLDQWLRVSIKSTVLTIKRPFHPLSK